MPIVIKLHYSVKRQSLKEKYEHNLVYSNDEELLPADILDL